MRTLRSTLLHALLVSVVTLSLSSPAVSGQCGGGKITEIKEGGWNSDDLLLLVDYSDFLNQHPGTTFGGYIRYSADTLSAARLDAIRKLALTALVSGKTVLTYSHTQSCSNSTELKIYAVR